MFFGGPNTRCVCNMEFFMRVLPVEANGIVAVYFTLGTGSVYFQRLQGRRPGQ